MQADTVMEEYMKEKQTIAYYALIGLSLAFSILAVITLIPNPAASKPNVLGYRSVCSFAPGASAVCGLLAGITCTIRNRRVSAKAASTKYQPFIAPGLTALVLIAVLVVTIVRFSAAEAAFRDIVALTPHAGMRFGSLKDGTHYGSATETEVSAMVEMDVQSGRIADIRLIQAKNVEPRITETIFASVIALQSTEVDTVSGATASCEVLLKAVETAVLSARQFR